jgi:Rad3-related DNA helicase
VLTAKDKSCLSPGAGCSPVFCPHARGHHDRLLAALEDLLAVEGIDAAVVQRTARRHMVCPHELALDASEWCDLVIGDVNYVFDPRVSLRRYQDPERSSAGEQLYLVDEAHNLVERAREMYSAELTSSILEDMARATTAIAPELSAALRPLIDALPRAAEECDEMSSTDDTTTGASASVPHALAGPLEHFAVAAGVWLADESSLSAPSELVASVFDLLFFRATMERFDSRYATLVEASPAGLRVRLACLDPAPQLESRLGQACAAVLFSGTLTPLHYHAAVLGGGDRAVILALASPFPRGNLCVLVDRSVSTRYRDRAASLSRVARIVASVARARPGSYLAFAPSYEYLRKIRAAFGTLPGAEGIRVISQRPDMAEAERRVFLDDISSFGRAASGSRDSGSLVGFAVMGGLFGEAVDLPGEGLVGAVVIGLGLPAVSPARELIRVCFEEQSGQGFAYAYAYPGIGRVLQAAGRVIRSETDRGVVVLVDERFGEAPYRELLPAAWEPLRVVRGPREVARELAGFWSDS